MKAFPNKTLQRCSRFPESMIYKHIAMRSYLASLFVVFALATPAFSGETVHPLKRARTSKVSTLNTKSASQLAASLANTASKRRFGVAPFSASRATRQLVRGRWHWQAIAGYGRTDLL